MTLEFLHRKQVLCSCPLGARELVAEGADPGVEVSHRRGELLPRAREASHPVGEGLLGAPQPRAHGALRDPEDLCELGRGQVLPVIELERELIVERDPPQRLEEQALLLVRREDSARRRGELVGGDLSEVRRDTLSAPLAEVGAEDVVRDAEEEGPEARLLLEAVARLDAAEECPLDQIVDAV